MLTSPQTQLAKEQKTVPQHIVQKQMTAQEQLTARELYEEGLVYAQRAEWGAASTAFRKAIALDPNSPAVQSLAMINDILDFYHKDNFNP